jgi:hypothetical protein
MPRRGPKPWQDASAERFGKEEQRRNSEEGTRHERMNPPRKMRRTVGVEVLTRHGNRPGRTAVENPIIHGQLRHIMLCSQV